MPRGEKRAGGRPKGSKDKIPGKRALVKIEKEAAREVLRDLVKASLPEMVAAQIANAHGLNFLVLREKKSGKFIKRITDTEGDIDLNPEREIVEVWAKDPSVQAFTDLLNRTLDKPTETLEATVTVGGLDVRIREARKRVAG